MNELDMYREEINRIDFQLVKYFEQRLAVSRAIAEYKAAHGLPIRDPGREKQVLYLRQAMARGEFTHYVRKLFLTLMRLSRQEQETWLAEHPLTEEEET